MEKETKGIKLAYKMRYAENYYLKTNDDSKKLEVLKRYEKLSAEDKKDFEEMCSSLAI